MKLILVLLTGTAVFVLSTIFRILLNKISQKYSSWKKLYKLFPLIGITLWTIYVFWGIGILFREQVFYTYLLTGLVLAVVGLISWFFIRDIFAGALIKMQNDLNPDDYVKIGDLSGQIKSARPTHLVITSDTGETIKIPNTRLSKEFISSTSSPYGMEEHNIHLTIDKKFTKPEIEKKIKYVLANSAWCNFKHPPVIKLKNEGDGKIVYDVQVYTLNKRHLSLVEKALEKKLGRKDL